MNEPKTADTFKVFYESILKEEELTLVLKSEFRGNTTELSRAVLNLKEKKIREALMQMGWIPPEAEPYWDGEKRCFTIK